MTKIKAKRLLRDARNRFKLNEQGSDAKACAAATLSELRTHIDQLCAAYSQKLKKELAGSYVLRYGTPTPVTRFKLQRGFLHIAILTTPRQLELNYPTATCTNSGNSWRYDVGTENDDTR